LSRGKALSKKVRDPENSTLFELADRLHSASIHLLRRVRKDDVKTGEGPARLSALSVLVFGGPRTLGEVAAAEQVKPPTMSRIIAGLERAKLVQIQQDPTDARRKRIYPTAKGVHLMLEARQARVTSLVSKLKSCSSDEIAKLEEGVKILMKVLERWI